MAEYAHPEVLVSTDWVAGHGNDPNVKVVEVDVDTKAYDEGHVPGALALGLEHPALRHCAPGYLVQRAVRER